ncbi:zinc finger BED domain-containing protein 1-like, partial [Temnothorax curvispinosus]|uniref:Zinc finger BED domain-containing protein 1-like n=1 Tax=Temnothorax curvispinosus TaxID=300111 RepID=A0A6J1QDD5_9HYME
NPIWNYFVKSDTVAKCKICQLNVKTSGNTTNLHFHMNRCHPDVQMEKSTVFVKTKRQISEVDNEDIIDLDDPVSSPGPSTSISSETETRSVSVLRNPIVSSKQPRIDSAFAKQKSYQDGGSKAADVTNKLLFMIAKDNLPFRVVEKEGFKTFMNAILPLYTVPSRRTITHLVEEKYEVLSNMMKAKLSQVNYLSLTTDIWTESLNMKSFLGLTAHFLVEEQHRSVTIGVVEMTERHQSEYLKNWLLNLIDTWNIQSQNIVAVVSDNAANIKKAIVDAFGADKHLPCFAHTLNLVLARIIDDDNIVKGFCAKIKNIVTYFKKSVIAADQLRIHSNLKLIQSVETRWNSTYNMLQRFIQLSEKISVIILQCPTAPPMLTASELQSTKEFVELLKPFEEATKIICGEYYLTASKVIPVVNILKNTLQAFEPSTDIGHHFKKALKDQLSKRFETIEHVSSLAMATILDPRFKNINFSDKVACSHAINKITRFVNSKVTDINHEFQSQQENSDNNDKTNFWSYHENLVNLNIFKQIVNQDPNQMPEDFRYYLNQPPLKMSDNAIKYWNMARDSPLRTLAIKYLSLIATSVPSERLFSEAGCIAHPYRRRVGRLALTLTN